MATIHHLKLPVKYAERELVDICQRWKITELSLFGSVLRDDFSPDSDADVLVTFDDDAAISLFDLFRIEEELTELFGKKVDLIDKLSVDSSPNKYRRESILSTYEVVYDERAE